MDPAATLGIILALIVMLPPSAFLFSWTPIGRAITQRLKGQNAPESEKFDEILDSVFELHGTMDRVGADMEDMQDRLSFAERLLTAGAEREKELTPV
jgi:hypothetical protein